MSAVTDNDLVRLWMIGGSGSGKSTLSRAISEKTSTPWIQLDALYHQPNWTPRPKPELRTAVEHLISGPAWVVDGNYTGSVADLVLARADTVVLLNLPRHVVMRQVTWRTMRRFLTREELWNGNRESLRNIVSVDKERSIILWAWVTHGKPREFFAAARARESSADVRFVELRSRRSIGEFLDGLEVV